MKTSEILIGLLILSVSLNIYFMTLPDKVTSFTPLALEVEEVTDEVATGVIDENTTGIIYQQDCPKKVTKSRLCSIEVLEKRSDFSMLQVHYHYVKNVSDSTNRIVVKSNKGSHDNVVGTRGGFNLKEGDNIIDMPFGMYRAGTYSDSEPYVSKYIMVKAREISAGGHRYITPPIFEKFAKYEHVWFVDGDKPSWK
ncbi:MAG: hypothetical protein QM484_02660 [Woeseiaceae bacterium]